jgi:hypothetical protein
LDGISKTIQKSTLAPFPLEPFRHRRFQSIQSINLTKQSHFSFRVVAKVNNYLTMVRPNTRASGRQAEDEDLDNQRPSGRPQRTVKAPQVFTFSSPIVYYLEHCHPEAKKFYAAAATKKQRAEYKKKYPDRDIWYCPSGTNGSAGNYGRNNFPDIFKWCARLCGAPNWENCTGHGLRSYVITILVQQGVHPLDIADIVRHSSTILQKYYAKETNDRRANRHLAMRYNRGNPAPEQAQGFKHLDNWKKQQAKQEAATAPKDDCRRPSNRRPRRDFSQSESEDSRSVSTYSSASPGYQHGHYHHHMDTITNSHTLHHNTILMDMGIHQLGMDNQP